MLLKMPVFIYNSVLGGPALGELGCQVYGFLGGLTGTASIVTLACIGLDRYYVIVHPLDPIRRTTRLRARLCVLFVWIYSFTFSVIPLTTAGLNRYVPEGFLTSCSFDYLNPSTKSRVFILVFFAAAWLLPFLVLAFSYAMICHVVVTAREVKPGTESSRHCRENDKRRTELRLAEVVLGVVGLWFVSWTPYAIIALLGITGHHQYITPLGSMIPALFCKAASCIDPFVYAVTHPRFHQELVKLYHRMKKRRKSFDNRSLAPNSNMARRMTINSNSIDGDGDQMVVVNLNEVGYPKRCSIDDDVGEDSGGSGGRNVYCIPMRMDNNCVEETAFHIETVEDGANDVAKYPNGTGSSRRDRSGTNSTSSSATSHSGNRFRFSLKGTLSSGHQARSTQNSEEMDNPLYSEVMQQCCKEMLPISTTRNKRNHAKNSKQVEKKSKNKKKQPLYPRKLLGKSPKQNAFSRCEMEDLEAGFMLSLNQLGIVRPPSWFNLPKPKPNRATSLRVRERERADNDNRQTVSDSVVV